VSHYGRGHVARVVVFTHPEVDHRAITWRGGSTFEVIDWPTYHAVILDAFTHFGTGDAEAHPTFEEATEAAEEHFALLQEDEDYNGW
jgi:hypothetical protein